MNYDLLFNDLVPSFNQVKTSSLKELYNDLVLYDNS